jgi:hypothetical protein
MTREKRTYLDRLNGMPGMQQAFRLTMKAAVLASQREDGETDEERFRDLKLKIAGKVAELWELSPMMGQYLIQRWVEAKPKLKVELREDDLRYLEVGLSSELKGRGEDLELEILFTGKDVSELSEMNRRLERSDTRVITEKQIRKEHLYLDVTGLSYKDLRCAYEGIAKCREMLGVELREVRRGAPESMDFTRALLAAVWVERGFSRKEVAKMLGFKIYRGDVRSGTYPLFQKYLKAGRWILHRLTKLDEYIHELTGIEVDTL